MKKSRTTFLRLELPEGRVGWGEHAPAERVTGESIDKVRKDVGELVKNADWVDRLLEDSMRLPGGAPGRGASNALSTAWLDAEGQRQAVPANRILNLPEGRLTTSVTLGINKPKIVLERAEEYVKAGWGIFKMKLGGPDDEETLKAVKDRFPSVPIRVDANEGWTLDRAFKMIPLLRRAEVEFLEQPLKRDDMAGLRRLNLEQDLPIFLDESVLDSDQLLAAVRAEAGDGVVIKLAKCGGPFEARRMIKIARDHGWKIMLGCMIESSVGISAAASLVGGADYADLDGNILIDNDPFSGSVQAEGRVSTPRRPGLGVAPSETGARLEPMEKT